MREELIMLQLKLPPEIFVRTLLNKLIKKAVCMD
jgi:hypothetical protein